MNTWNENVTILNLNNFLITKSNKLTKLDRCDRETIELANYSNDSIVRTAGRASK